jgi:hypothetical protein
MSYTVYQVLQDVKKLLSYTVWKYRNSIQSDAFIMHAS